MSRGTVPGAALAGPDVVGDDVVIAVEGGTDLTRGQWDGRSNALARGLRAHGVGPGDRVALLFEGRRWADFAVASVGVRKAGGVAVLLSPGAAGPDLRRALRHSGAAGVLGGRPGLVEAGGGQWSADPDEVASGFPTGPVDWTAPAGAAGDRVYPPAPLAPARPLAVSGGAPVPSLDGWLVHAWGPGSAAGQRALDGLWSGAVHGLATVAAFDPERLCALVERRRAVALGLTPALAAAVLASEAHRRHDVSTIRHLLVSGPPSPALRPSLACAFPEAAVTALDAEPTWLEADAAPVAVSQEAMLWHEQFVPGSFNVPCLVRRYEGPLDVGALEWALSELIRRHQPLRSTFVLVDGRPGQVVGDDRHRPLAIDDLSALPLEERHAEASRLIAEATSRPFDLVAGPLFQPRLVRLGPDDHLLLVRLHHTVFDDWSVDLFRREVSALYSARSTGGGSPLVEPRLSFVDVCRRQRDRLAAGVEAEQRSWWRGELNGAPLAVQLPIGRGEGEPVRVDLPLSLAADVRAVAPTLRATPFMTVLAAFSALVARMTGQGDLLLATVVAHRNRSDVEPLIGCFTKKVPVRVRVAGEPTFAELVARTRASLLGSLSHQDVAFDAALHQGVGAAAAAHGVVPQVAVVFQGETPQLTKLALPGLVVGPYDASRAERHFSSGPDRGSAATWGAGIYLGSFLILSLLDTPDGMGLVARGVFDRPCVRRLLADFQQLLAALVADPSLPIVTGGEEAGADVLDLRGFPVRRSALESALTGCPGVSDVAVAVHDVDGEDRLVASIVPGDGPPPTLTQLRRTLWEELPGAPWPAHAVSAGGQALAADPHPLATTLAAMWGEISGRSVGTTSSYWQDFSFLDVLAEARAAGIDVGDEDVVRCRTPEALALAVAVARRS